MKKLLLFCYAHLLCMYPRSFRREYEREMRLLMRDRARDRGALALSVWLFSDLLVSVPQQHFYEARMKHSRETIVHAVSGTLLLLGAALFVIDDLARPDRNMGFPLVLVLATGLIIGMWLIAIAKDKYISNRWVAPVAYATAASLWLVFTPRVVDGVGPIEHAILSLPRGFGMFMLFIPIVLAALNSRVSTILMTVFVALTITMIGAYYIPALVALVALRFWPQRTMPAINAS